MSLEYIQGNNSQADVAKVLPEKLVLNPLSMFFEFKVFKLGFIIDQAYPSKWDLCCKTGKHDHRGPWQLRLPQLSVSLCFGGLQ